MDHIDKPPSVRRRRVFYIPGYDPIPPRRYRELYRSESAAQGKISGYDIEIAASETEGNFGWKAKAIINDNTVEANIDVLVWSDIVRGSMNNSIPATYLQMLRTAWTYITSGTLRRLMWLRKGPVIAALYPVGVLILQLLGGILLGAFAAALVLFVINFALDLLGVSTGFLTPFIRWAIILGVTWQVLKWFQKNDGKFFVYYLMHDYAHSARWKGAYDPELETRLKDFGASIANALSSDVDEVLVVGHSSGAHLAVSILADLIRDGKVPNTGPTLSFLSLGQVVPMVSFLPKAYRLRSDLAFLSQRDEVTWIDVTAPGDGCAFALCDPVEVTGVAPRGKKWPLVLSAAFTQTLSPERWKELRWRFFRLHFQYLCAFDRPGHYDYFQITCGPHTLADRYEGRAPSPARIDVPASKFTDLAP